MAAGVLHNIRTEPVTSEPTSMQDDPNTSGLPEELADLEAKDRSLLGDHETISKAGLATHQLPKSLQEADIADKVLSEDFKKLSLDEQEKAIFALHGLPRQNDEDPDEIETLLEKLDQEIGKIRRKEAYNLAVYLNESYVTSREFRLLFLRCDKFDAKLAAQRIVFHFEAKKKLFGDKEVLGRDIRQSDLSPTEVHLLHSGFLQSLSTPDAAGRPIFLIAPALRPTDIEVEVIHRVMWYFFHLQLAEEEAQRKGIVGIWIQLGKNPKLFVHRPAFQGVLQIRSSFPVKWAGLHFCFDDPSIRLHVTGLSMNMNQEMRKHLRIHFGSFDTIKFELGTFGIQLPPDVILGDGTISADPHLEWTSARRTVESEVEATDRSSMFPRRFDVLFGRGERTRGHTGNLRAAHLVEMHRTEYEQAQRLGKTEIAEKIVDMVHESYGRFMRWDVKGWVEVSHEAAREKVSHFFRHLRSKNPNPPAASSARKSTDGNNHVAKQAQESISDNESVGHKRNAPEPAEHEIASEPTKRVTPSPSPMPLASAPTNQTETLEGTKVDSACGNDREQPSMCHVQNTKVQTPLSRSESCTVSLCEYGTLVVASDPCIQTRQLFMKTKAASKSKDEMPLTLSEFDLRERGLFVDHEFLSKAGLSPHRFPESDRETEIAQQVLSEELAGLSLVEHEKVVFDVHGLPQASVEDPDNLQELLQHMEKEIQKISNKVAYDRAVYWDKSYVTSDEVRLRFLRGDFYNARLAAHRMIFHFDLKKKLFGEGEILGRDIRLSDLTKEDRDVLELGFVQVLPTRDVAGRLVMVIVPTLARHCPPQNHLRALWFFFSAVFNDDDNIRRGVVDLVLNIGKNVIKGTLESVREAMSVRAGIPKRIGCLHYCFDNPAMLPYATGLQLSVDAESRKRFRLHQGSYESIKFKLQTYGIPIQDYAMTADGTMSLDWHNEWLQQHERWDKEHPVQRIILVPQRYDVLFGRGKGSREHTGNLRAGHIVAMLQTEYEDATKMEKTKIAERVVTMVKDSGGRFLKWGEGGWSEVDFMVAREKVSHFFRQLRTVPSTGTPTGSVDSK